MQSTKPNATPLAECVLTNGYQNLVRYDAPLPQASDRRLWRAVLTKAQKRRSLTVDALSQKYSTELFTSIEYINLL
ncbi:MAG: hypothetical protein V7K67_14930 [Nostoc sp.]|uniref:hypothetical protein n=1 Tax=Nostoc sp. TaxID=1180 RepID=UPI002FFA6A37